MLVAMSGTRGGVDWPPAGGVLECDDAEGEHLVRAGIAAPVPDEPAPVPDEPGPEEHAVTEPAETATPPKVRRPRKPKPPKPATDD